MSEQKSSKLPPLPVVLTGNDLLEGHAVWFDGAGWTADPAAAQIAADEPAARALETLIPAAEATIVEPYLANVRLDAAGRPAAAHYREKIRVVGPTFALEGAL